MSVAHIKFENRQDEATGVEQLALRARIYAYRDGIYAVRPEDLQWLDGLNLAYRFATEEEVEAARGSVRHPVAAPL